MDFLDKIADMATAYAPKLILALVTLFGGFWLVKRLVVIMEKGLKHRRVEASLASFLRSLVSIVLRVLILLTVAKMVGIETTSFVALLGAAGLAIGLSLQGSLSNFAGGFLIIFFKPFKVGDLIEAEGHLGVVHEIQIFSSILKTLDNKTVIIPNGILSNASIKNYSTEKNLRVDMQFGIGYGDDIKKAKKILLELITADKRIHNTPEPLVVVANLGASSVDLEARVWCKNQDYWNVYFDMMENVKIAYDKHKISIPYPQRDIHLHQANKSDHQS